MNSFASFLRHLLTAVVCAAVLVSPAHAYPSQEWRFNVLLDNKPIGQHRFRLKLESDHQVLQSEADYNIRILGFSVFRYQHVATERWEGGCLTDIQSRTDHNGEVSVLEGRRNNAGFMLSNPNGETTLAGCIMSFAYWNPAILTQPSLLNAQTGDYLPIRVQDMGSDSLALANSEVMAKRYRLITSKFSIDLWYGSNNEWLALETRTEGGRLLRYVIDPAYYSLNRKNHYA
ncbi:MAG: DUF6134 family protein [Thiobacillaceae bacterium]|jgi:hypothetical protein